MEPKENKISLLFIGLAAGFLLSAVLIVAGLSVIRAKGFSIFGSKKDSTNTAMSDDTINKVKVIEDTINNYYYKTEVDRAAEADAIYKGVVASLQDPYSEYYTTSEYEDLMSDTEGIYYGIGAYVSMDKDTNLPRVTGTIKDSPAEKIGIKANDVIYKVAGENVQGLTLNEVVQLIRGEIGTKVKITIYREGEPDYLEFEVERDKLETQTVNTTMLEDDIGYLGITEFDSVTPGQFTEGMTELRSKGMKALILDLRSNPGGSLSAVCQIARQILPQGDIVYTVDRDGNREDYECDGKNEIDIPLVVMVNGYSASASEILSGAIKDYGKGTIVGETTYGKGVVQRIFPFTDGTAVKLTISNYFTPKGTDINGVGITPDVEIALDYEKYNKDGTDNQLNKAIEIIKKEIKSSALDDAA
ncbi:carboxyl-terminal processing protease [Butyrivibrio sp. ob235]|uniref:S41 family peptidase n=1 Tax=Butyrivibrio sp. ob235 TaxID=1761780 RepID=UPI0008AD213F|nr:S41 family peptidase [Butyrivibrio sp. ob235]SEK81265.1 carboxyl-terminal processing protease [Butyrivibrio sp. ob235]